MQNGVISAWRGSSEAKSPFELVASLSGHTKAVVCLAVGGKMLYSGSMDHSIKVCLSSVNAEFLCDFKSFVISLDYRLDEFKIIG